MPLAMTFCARCGAASTPGAAYCASCGASLAPAGVPSASPTSSPSRPPSPSTGVAVAGLILNLFLWPGLGTLVAGDKRGWPQGFLALAGGALAVFAFFGVFLGIAGGSPPGIVLAAMAGLAGFAMSTAAWIWALITSIQHLSNKSPSV